MTDDLDLEPPAMRRRLAPTTAELRFFEEGDAMDHAAALVELPSTPSRPHLGWRLAVAAVALAGAGLLTAIVSSG